MRKPTTIKAEIAENKELLKAKGILQDEKAFIEDEIKDLENELEEALKAETTPKKPITPKKAAPKKRTAAKKKPVAKKTTIVFNVGDVFDTQGNSNMKGKVTLTKIAGNSLFFTDADGTTYQGFSRSQAKILIEEGRWKKVSSAKKSATPKEKKFVMVDDKKVFEDDPKFCEIIIDRWQKRKEAIKKADGKRKTKSVIQRAAADVADAVSKGIRNFKVDEIKKDPKAAINKMEKLEKAGKEFLGAYKDILGEKISQKEIKEEFEGLDKAIKQISDKYLKEKMAKGGETKGKKTYKYLVKELFDGGMEIDSEEFSTLEEAEKEFQERLKQDGYKPDGRESWSIEIEKITLDEDGDEVDYEQEEGQVMYQEGTMDRSNYKGASAINYGYDAHWDAKKKELVYNFYFQGELTDEDIPESKLKDWYYNS